MKKFLSNYKTTIILLVAIIVGAIVGILFQEKATKLQPLGDIFLNLLFVIIVPLIFLTITTSIAKMENPKRLGKIMITIIIVFVVTSLIAVLLGFASTYFVKLVNPEDGEKIRASLEEKTEESAEEDVSIADRIVQLLTVNDFSKLLSKDNVIALLVFSIICGIAIRMSNEKGKVFLAFLVSANEVVQNYNILCTNRNRMLFCSTCWNFWSINCCRIFKDICCIYNCFISILLYSLYNICFYSRRKERC